MATPTDPAYRQHLQALAEKYRATVPQRMAAIEAALAAAGEMPGPDALAALHESLHVVAGSAGSFGLRALGDEARRLEGLLREAIAGTGDWNAIAPQVRRYLAWAQQDPTAPSYSAHD
jgi:HPt (histidine-containing phosphotransfer) domain-containing protein